MARPWSDHRRRAFVLLPLRVSTYNSIHSHTTSNLSHSCLSARRRRKRGHSPLRGTGWTLGKTPNNPNTAQPYYANTQQTTQPYYNNSNNPAPPPTYGGANNSYYGKDNSGVQPPQQAYGGYAPPAGPPPGRNY
jgi:hypothetical protein